MGGNRRRAAAPACLVSGLIPASTGGSSVLSSREAIASWPWKGWSGHSRRGN